MVKYANLLHSDLPWQAELLYCKEDKGVTRCGVWINAWIELLPIPYITIRHSWNSLITIRHSWIMIRHRCQIFIYQYDYTDI